MPQMCIDGLSENWLFKYLGANHWEMLCRGLGTDSTHLQNEDGERLYASFVRIRMDAARAICAFRENEHITLNGQLQRYGNEMYFSDFAFTSQADATKTIQAQLMTIFSVRASSGNQKLLRSEARQSNAGITALKTMPAFGQEYRKIKLQKLTSIRLKGHEFVLSDAVLFEKEYRLNPYYDVNGVGLIYFAAYPTISDSCESHYFNTLHPTGKRWEQQYFTLARDLLYYANCELSDTIIYRLNQVEHVDADTVCISSSLYRQSDGALMARLFTVKGLSR